MSIYVSERLLVYLMLHVFLRIRCMHGCSDLDISPSIYYIYACLILGFLLPTPPCQSSPRVFNLIFVYINTVYS